MSEGPVEAVEYVMQLKHRAESAERDLQSARSARVAAQDGRRDAEIERDQLREENAALQKRLEDAHLARIEAQNPGIDMERVQSDRAELISLSCKPCGISYMFRGDAGSCAEEHAEFYMGHGGCR